MRVEFGHVYCIHSESPRCRLQMFLHTFLSQEEWNPMSRNRDGLRGSCQGTWYLVPNLTSFLHSRDLQSEALPTG